jgi:hypothetical protein
VVRGPHTEELEAYADRMVDCYAELAPNLKGAILHREVIGPWQMEREWGLVGGNIFHGELSADQLFHMRPAPGYADHRSPIAGLYQASSATHGGGGSAASPAGRPSRPSWPTAGPSADGEPGGPGGPHGAARRDPGASRRPPPPHGPARAPVGGGGGASARPGSFGDTLVAQLLGGGFRGPVHLVNRS